MTEIAVIPGLVAWYLSCWAWVEG